LIGCGTSLNKQTLVLIYLTQLKSSEGLSTDNDNDIDEDDDDSLDIARSSPQGVALCRQTPVSATDDEPRKSGPAPTDNGCGNGVSAKVAAASSRQILAALHRIVDRLVVEK
jgi:hypothetical protein